MAPRDAYRAQVELLIRCLPAVAHAPEFALKGGTAINLFHHDMPRLSMDIDPAQARSCWPRGQHLAGGHGECVRLLA